MRPLRFCFITTFYPPYHFGGDAIFVYRLAHALAERGHTVHVIHSVDAFKVNQQTPPVMVFTGHDNIQTFPLETALPIASTLASYEFGMPALYDAALRAHFASHSYDVIHYHNVSLVGAPGVLRLGSAIKFYTAHEYWLVCPTHVLFKYNREACVQKDCLTCTVRSGRPPQAWRYTNLLEDCLSELDALIVPSDFSMRRHRSEGIAAPIRVLPHFVPVPADRLGIFNASGTQARPYFLFAGRLEKLKGVQDAVAVFRELPHVDLKIVGTGSLDAELREQARGSTNIHFLGFVHPDALAELYQSATATVVPSLCYETFALSAAESMAHGTPVIGRQIGAVQELIESSGGGITFSSFSEFQLAVALMLQPADPPLVELRMAAAHILQPSELRQTLARCGRAYAEANWTLDTHLGHYFALIAETGERQRHGASPPQE